MYQHTKNYSALLCPQPPDKLSEQVLFNTHDANLWVTTGSLSLYLKSLQNLSHANYHTYRDLAICIEISKRPTNVLCKILKTFLRNVVLKFPAEFTRREMSRKRVVHSYASLYFPSSFRQTAFLYRALRLSSHSTRASSQSLTANS